MKHTSINSLTEKIFHLFKKKEEKLFLILIGGLSRSGKSTLSKNFKKKMLERSINCNIICLDNWIVDIDKRTNQETVRERFAYSSLTSSISNHLQGKDIRTSKYNPITRKKSDSKYVVNSIDNGIIIVEGVIALDVSKLRKMSSLNIFVETSEVVRKKRFHEFHTNFKMLSQKQSELIYSERQIDENIIVENSRHFSDLIYQN